MNVTPEITDETCGDCLNYWNSKCHKANPPVRKSIYTVACEENFNPEDNGYDN